MVHSFPGTKVPGNEKSSEQMVHAPFVPENESSTMGMNSLGNEQS